MTIQLPTTVQNKGLTENQLILIAFLHRLRTMYQSEWYSIYKYDLGVILQHCRTCHPLMMFEGLTPYIRVRYSSDYKMDLKLKQWTEETFEYQIKDFRNVIVWSVIEDNHGYLEVKEPKESQKFIPKNRILAAALNTHYMEYGRIRLRK